MYKKYSAVLPLFLDLVGDRPVDQLKQIDIENYCLDDLPTSASVVRTGTSEKNYRS
jgi:hypothetical protein